MYRLLNKYNLLIHIYMLFSLAGNLLLIPQQWLWYFPRQDVAWTLLTVGASSGYVAFGFAYNLTSSSIFGVISFLWCILFPFALIAVYIISLKKTKKLFCSFVIVDTVFVFLWCLYALITKNYYSVNLFMPDLVVSFIYTILLIKTINKSSCKEIE